jgi:hypothetical protein
MIPSPEMSSLGLSRNAHAADYALILTRISKLAANWS